LDGESLTQFLVLSGVNLGDEHWWVSLAELLSSSSVLWDEFLAVTTKGKKIVK
jgi:hypothetical protein